jgi:hypothetical protein
VMQWGHAKTCLMAISIVKIKASGDECWIRYREAHGRVEETDKKSFNLSSP